MAPTSLKEILSGPHRCRKSRLSFFSSQVAWACLLGILCLGLTTPTSHAWSILGKHHEPEDASRTIPPHLHRQDDLSPSVVDQEDGVYVLSDSNFDEFVKSNPSVLIMFYAPWCHWCRDLMPKYTAAAKVVETLKLPVKLAKVDTTRNAKLSESQDISAYPTLKLFLDGEQHSYNGGREQTEIVHWLKTRLDTNLSADSPGVLDALLKAHTKDVVVIGHFNGAAPKSYDTYISTFRLESRRLDAAIFIQTHFADSAEYLVGRVDAPLEIKVKPNFILLVNPHDEGDRSAVPYEPRSVLFKGKPDDLLALSKFVRSYLFPALVPFSAEVAPKAFNDGRPILVLFTENGKGSDPATIKAVAVVKKLGYQYRDSFIFIHSDGGSIFDRRLQALLGIENEPFPTLRLFRSNPSGHGTWYSTLKYRPSLSVLERMDPQEIGRFIEDFTANKLRPFVRSEPIPSAQDNPGPVYTLVADAFDEVVHKSPHDILVEFYAPWCGHCRKLEPAYRKLAIILKSAAPQIKVMKMDATLNEINLMIVGYPTLVFYSASAVANGERGQKRAHFYYGERSVEKLVEWLATRATTPFNPASALQAPTSDIFATEDPAGPAFIPAEL